MISNFGFIILIIILFIIGYFCEFYEGYKNNSNYEDTPCYKRHYYTCLKCDKKTCKYHLIAKKFE